MAGRGCHWMTCILMLAGLAGQGMLAGHARAAQSPFGVEEAEDFPDMEYVRHQAEAGKARFQTQLADHYLGSSDFTNALVWYRKAAAQGHVPAQLSLAGCLLSGKGEARNPKEAARWLRQAADRIEAGDSAATTAPSQTPSSTAGRPTPAKTAPTSIVITNSAKIAARPVIAVPSNSVARPAPLSSASSPRLQRAETLISAPAVLQEVQSVVALPSSPAKSR